MAYYTMTFGLNELVNDKTKQVRLNHNLGTSKVFLPHTQNHEKREKQHSRGEVESHEEVEKSKTLKNDRVATKSIKTLQQNGKVEKIYPINSHDLNKSVLIILAAGVGWYLFR